MFPPSTPPFHGRLHHLQLGSPDPQRLARFYEDVFEMSVERVDENWICRGRDRCLMLSPGAPKTLMSAGFQLRDQANLEGLAARLGSKALAAARPGLFAGPSLSAQDPDGNLMFFGLETETSEPRPAFPVRLQHLVMGSRDITKMVDYYTRVIGLRVSDHVFDENGTIMTSFMRGDHEHHCFAIFQTSKSGLDHHCYELAEWNSIRDWGDRLAARRIPVSWGPGRHGPGNNLFLFFHDPDGNWLEVSAELEVVAEDRQTGSWPHEEYTLNSWGTAYLRG